LGTIELSTGLQVSGNFDYVISHDGKPVYFQTTGKSALAFREKELVGQDTNKHTTGFGSPIGRLKGINIAIEEMSPRDLKAYKIYEGEEISLDFEGDINVSGKIITGTRNLQGQIILITFENCTVTHQGKILFQSATELYNMAIGEHIVSAYNGPADVKSFDLLDHELSTTSSSESNNSENGLEIYYQQIRDFREGTNTTISRNKVFNEVKLKFPNDWLLSVELYELAVRNGDTNFALEIKSHLKAIKQKHSKLEQLIDDGLALADTPA
jgi:phenylalanine-4-hydroxylase